VLFRSAKTKKQEPETKPAERTETDLGSVVPCSPPPLFVLTEGREIWVITDLAPFQNFWENVAFSEIGLVPDSPRYRVYRYQQKDAEAGELPSPKNRVNAVMRVGTMRSTVPDGNPRTLEVGLCVSRRPGWITGRKEDAVRAARELRRQMQGTDIGVFTRHHWHDTLSSSDLQAIAGQSVLRQPAAGAVVVCDMEYDSGWWHEELLNKIRNTPWVGALFYTSFADSLAVGSTVWDATLTNEICAGLKLSDTARLEPFVSSREPPSENAEPYRLILDGKPGVIAVGMVAPSLPRRIIELLRLISILRHAKISTDVATLSDYLEKSGRAEEAVLRTEGTLRSAVMLLGSDLDAKARIYQDSQGQWVHTLPLGDLGAATDTDELENYRWYPMLSQVVADMLRN